MLTERWLPVVGYEGLYEVSDHGRVRSLRFSKLMRLSPNVRTGHLYVSLRKDNAARNIQVHRLVLAAFIGPCPEGLLGLHWDDDPLNNHVGNLRYGSHSDNRTDSVRNGSHPMTRRTHCVHGHAFTPENTYTSGGSRRRCKPCQMRRQRESRSRSRKESVA